jgi:hypothetical protein
MTYWIAVAFTCTSVEVGRDCHRFYHGFFRTQSSYDSMWVIMDFLNKAAHFIPIKTTYTGLQLEELYMLRIVCLHGVSKKIVSDRGTQFTSKFWERLLETLNTQLNYSSSYHPVITIIWLFQKVGRKQDGLKG